MTNSFPNIKTDTMNGVFIDPKKFLKSKMTYNILSNCLQNIPYATSTLIYYTSQANIRKTSQANIGKTLEEVENEVEMAVHTLIICNRLDCRGVIKSLVYFHKSLYLYLSKCRRLYPEDFSWMLTESIEQKLENSFELLISFYINRKEIIKGEYDLDFLETFPRLYNDRGILSPENRDIADFLKVDVFNLSCDEKEPTNESLTKKLMYDINKVLRRLKKLDELTLLPTFDTNAVLNDNPLYLKARDIGLIDYYYEEKMLIKKGNLQSGNVSCESVEGENVECLGNNEFIGYSKYNLLGPFYFGYNKMSINHKIVKHFIEYAGDRMYELFYHWINHGYDISYREFIVKYVPDLQGMIATSASVKKKAVCKIFLMHNPTINIEENEILLTGEYLDRFCSNYISNEVWSQ